MDAMLKELFGGDGDDRKPQARDFVSRVEQGKIDEGYSDNEAFENFQRVAQHAKPETIQRAAEQAFSRMDPGQRAQLAQMLQQQQGGGTTAGAIQDDPRQMAGMVSQIHRDTPGGLSALMGGGAAGATAGGGGGIGETLGNLFGGGGGDQTQAQTTDQGGGFPGGTLGKVALGGIAAFALKEILSGRDDESADAGADKRRKRSV